MKRFFSRHLFKRKLLSKRQQGYILCCKINFDCFEMRSITSVGVFGYPFISSQYIELLDLLARKF